MGTRRRIIAGIVAAVLVLATADLAAFGRRTAALTPSAEPSADAIVSLTGGSTLRIKTGVDLLTAGAGERLLISGVNPSVDADAVRAQTGGEPALFACCIDLGREALTTVGNAAETAAWADEHGYESLLVVTSNYHMPRSLLELRHAMPDVELIAHPVRSGVDPARTWRDGRSFKGVLVEWAKWRVAALRRGVFG